MTKSANPAVRKAIRAELLDRHKRNIPIDQEEIKARYTKEHPHLRRSIPMIVTDYTAFLEKQKKPHKLSSATRPSRQNRSEVPAVQTVSTGLPICYASSVTEYAQIPVPKMLEERPQEDWAVDPQIPFEVFAEPTPLMKDFQDHLAGGEFEEQAAVAAVTAPVMPPLDEQLHFLSSDEEDEMMAVPLSAHCKHAALLSTALEKQGYGMPSQFALLGKLKPSLNYEIDNPDPRVVLNANVPFSVFICGLQGSGKSHTTSCIIENCSMTMQGLGNLKQSVSTLVLHFNEYSSNINAQPSEAAFLASVLPKYASEQQHIPVRVLVSPTNFHNLSAMYAHIPNVEVRPFGINPRHLNIEMMISLMSLSQGEHIPLYMAQVLKVLREMAMQSGGKFDYADFRRRLANLRLDRHQTPFLAQRLDLLDSYLDLAGQNSGDYFVGGGVTILDLSCPFVDQSTSCVLFRIAIDLFLYTYRSRAKMVVADEAHKYMNGTRAAKELTDSFLNIIRQQRHLGVRTIISTHEPTISPRLIDLCSITMTHRFTSPKWYETIRAHLPIDDSTETNGHSICEGLYQIASLRTGEAIVFAPSAQLVDGEGEALDTKHSTFRLMVRKRITWDGGRTILSVR